MGGLLTFFYEKGRLIRERGLTIIEDLQYLVWMNKGRGERGGGLKGESGLKRGFMVFACETKEELDIMSRVSLNLGTQSVIIA